MMPGEINKTDTGLLNGYWSTYNGITYMVNVYNNIGMEVDNPESFKEFMDGMVVGYTNKLTKTGYRKEPDKPIIIDSTDGRYVKLLATSSDKMPSELRSHLFLVNNVAYIITLAYYGPVTDEAEQYTKTFIDNIDFTSKNRLEKRFLNKSGSTGYKIGYLIGNTIIPIVIIGLVLFFIFRKKKPKAPNQGTDKA